MNHTIQKLRSLLSRRDKQFLVALLVFSVLISLIETVGISVIMPFVAVATNFTLIHENGYYSAVYERLGFENDISFVVSFGILLILFYILRSVANLVYFYLLNRFTQGRYHLLAYRLFENYMGLPYQTFVGRNSSVMTKSIVSEASNLTSLISAVLLMISEIFIVILIYAMMMYVNYKITVLVTLILAVNAILILKFVSGTIKKAGILRAQVQERFYEIINRSFGNFKLIKLQSNEPALLEEFGKASFQYAQSNVTNTTLQQVPRLFLEAVGFGIIVFIITYLVWKYETDISNVLALVSMFVLALYRLMPSVNRILTSYNQILFYHHSLDSIHSDLMYDSEALGNQKVVFEDAITLSHLYFEYEEGKPILQDVSLTIPKGAKVAFVGESGSGKSTLVDIIMGLYKPQRGDIAVDGTRLSDENIKSWRSQIGYIPQSIYLFDGTVGDNVVFGLPYDQKRVDEVLEMANIDDFLRTKEGANTQVGEGGIMLSGGQKQRIAIARALYADPKILVLDEATSALDSDTEAKIMEEIYTICEAKTLIIIAHRLSTIEGCEYRYSIQEGNILDAY